jgi:formate C-acetyltransferase|tara:strand:+ start:805 stop:2979 length:2175 start_codon:yes stop_codon:yes gene_type:complete
MTTQNAAVLELPFDSVCLNMTLSPELQGLRDAALRTQGSELRRIPTLPLIDAASWSAHTPDEDWLLWRARRTAERLRQMPLALSPGERIVGRPDLRSRTPEEVRAVEDAKATLRTIPPYPGGDAGHFHPDFEKLFRVGIAGVQAEIREGEQQASTEEQRTFYHACEIAIQGMSDYAKRVADACDAAADQMPEEKQWHGLARMCRNISCAPPSTFHEAIQLNFLTIIALWFGEDHGLTAPGRLDQTLRPFYEADLAAGRIDQEEAFELICLLFIQLNMILGPGSALSVMVGGRDRDGRDATCDLTYLCLSARLATQLVYPTVGFAWHEGTPSELTDFSCRMLRTGIGDPAFFNDELIVGGLRDHGVSMRDAYNYMNSTCVEIKVVGASNMWVTAPYFNCPRGLLDVMEKVTTGEAPEPGTFLEFNDLVRDQLATVVGRAAQQLDQTWNQRAQTGCFPLASCFIDDCLAKGMDFDRGGARYNWVENSFVGLANLVDGLIAIKHLVYDAQEISIPEFRELLRDDYAGQEQLRLRILNRLPSYGNGDAEADALAAEWAEILQDTTESNVVGLHKYVPGFFCWVIHERFGTNTGATPDGRKAGTALADGAGAAQGREKEGPTTSVLSTTRWNHNRALGGLVHNVKFSKATLRTEEDLAALRSLIETYLRRGGFEIQVNVVSADILRDAQAHPENYADLLVRIAGYSDYFVHLEPNMQAEVIERTEHAFG